MLVSTVSLPSSDLCPWPLGPTLPPTNQPVGLVCVMTPR